VLEVPFNYASISSFGGVVVVAAGITILFDREVWREVYGLLVFGGLTSLVVDGARVFADGTGGFWLYPVWIRPVAPSLYMSADPRVLAVVLSTAVVVPGVDYYRR
jgi:hypothetical protein